MGNETSEVGKSEGNVSTKPIAHDQEDIYILEDLANFSFKNKIRQPYFWIDPNIYNSENQKYESLLRKFLQIEGCSSVNGLLKEMEEQQSHIKIKVICAASLKDEDYQRLNENNEISAVYLFCQNQERAKLLMNNFPKIKSAKFDINELKNYLLQEEESDQNLQTQRTNLLIMIEDDTNLMNKYRIIFHSLTQGNSKVQAKTDFVNFAKKFYPESLNEIDEFDKRYQIDLTGKEALTQTTQWLIKPGFFWESTQTLPKMTTDPKKLAYLRFAFKESYEAIYKLHKSEPTYNFSQVYMLITPTEEELRKLSVNPENFLIFTTFTKAYTNEKYVKQALTKNKKSFAVTIILKTKPSMNEKLDFGYKVFSDVPPGAPDVIFNIYNVFCIKEFEPDEREIVLEYGSLAVVSKSTEIRNNLKDNEKNLLRNYDYLEDIISRISSQAKILQMSGYFQDSLKIYHQKLEIIRKSQPSEETLDKHKIELGDAYKINEEFAKAEEQFLSIKEGKMLLIAYVHLAELYFKTKETEKLSKIIALIDKNLGKYKDISSPDSFKAQNYIGMEMINQGRFKEACKLYKSLKGEVNEFYSYKFEGIPLVHEIYRNMAAAAMKEKNYDEALNLLDTTKGWQKTCEGNKSPGLIMTENLIMSVHLSRGGENKKEAENSAIEIKKIRKAVTLNDNIYMSRSAVILNLNESAINIQTTSASTGLPALQVGPPQSILEQSSINIEL